MMLDLKRLLTVVIPHNGGSEMLLDCLHSIARDPDGVPRVLIVDNASPDDSIAIARSKFDWIEILESETNRGYAGGCNFGLAAVNTPYALLLNNDVVVEPGCFATMVERLEAQPRVAAVQPKIRSFQKPDYFDYAGATGGLLDCDGIPFAFGRILDCMEIDHGQYDEARDIFWASGTAIVLRMDALREVGFLEEDFFAHQEEIDLCWRLQARGWLIQTVPKATLFHRGGATLNRSSNRKLYLNHRNSLLMWLRNNEKISVYTVSRRVTLEFAAFGAYLCHGDFQRARHQVAAWRSVLGRLSPTLRERRRLQLERVVSDVCFPGRYAGSVVWQYYFRRRRFTADFFHFHLRGE